MIPTWAFITQLVVYVLVAGVTIGVIKTKLDTLVNKVEKLDIGNENSRIVEERQSIINKNTEEKLDGMLDRLDVHDMAIKQIENDIIKITTKCSFHNDLAQ